MPAIDWAAAEDELTGAARDQFARFLAGQVRSRVYTVGFFFDPDAGDVYPVANTMDHHSRTYTSHVREFGPSDEYVHLWDSGNWEYPAGLAPSDSPEYLSFDRAWAPYREAIAASPEADRTTRFEDLCVGVLRRLAAEGLFQPAEHLMGYVVQSPGDAADELVAKQARVTERVNSPNR